MINQALPAARRLAARVRGDTGDPEAGKHLVGLRVQKPAWVPGFPHDIAAEAVAQQAEERLDPLGLEWEAWGKLDQQGAEALTQLARLAKEAVERIGAVHQPPLVGDDFRDLDREAEALGDRCRPARICLGLVRPIERAVDFNSGKRARVALQVASFRWKEPGMLPGNRPAGAADEYGMLAHDASTAALADWFPAQNIRARNCGSGRSCPYRTSSRIRHRLVPALPGTSCDRHR